MTTYRFCLHTTPEFECDLREVFVEGCCASEAVLATWDEDGFRLDTHKEEGLIVIWSELASGDEGTAPEFCSEHADRQVGARHETA